MRGLQVLVVGAFVSLSSSAALAAPVPLSFTNFESFTLGSVDGQGGWGVSNPAFDQSVVDDAGNRVWRVSNAVTSGSFGDQPFAPRPGGTGMTDVNPTNSLPQFFAGEASTGANWNQFFAEFQIKMTTANSVAGTRITLSPDNGNGARMGFLAIEDTGTGVRVDTFDTTNAGTFASVPNIGSFGYDAWQTIRIELFANDGPLNDVVNYYLNGALIHSGPSWEQFYTVTQPLLHPNGVPVQTLLFRISAPTGGLAAALGKGFFIDDVTTAVGVSEPATLGLMGAGLMGLALLRRRRAA